MTTRRQWLSALAAAGAARRCTAAASEIPGIALNEDNSHYFSTRAGTRLDAAAVDAWVDQYAGTQVRELMLNVNCMRTSYASQVWDPIWRGYDPAGPDDQPLLASMSPEARKFARNWIHTAWQLHRDGIDVYARWIARARRHGISPWVSVRMNDVHNVDDERSYIHGEFWREHPELRRVPGRFSGWTDRAFDYGRAEVRQHHLKLIREAAERYDMDGLELDWMRFGYHFRPGHEAEGARLLTGFTAEVRGVLNAFEKKRGHRIRLGARVPSRPQTALGLGYDVAAWADRRLVDMVIITPFFASTETDMPVEQWKQLLRGSGITLAAGLELHLRPYPDFRPSQKNSLETVRGAAASLLDRGADRLYLFNYMDSETAIDNLDDYPKLLRQAGDTHTATSGPRRHVVTYADTWAPGEPRTHLLPVACRKDSWIAVRVPTGPAPAAGANVQLRFAVDGVPAEQVGAWKVSVNGAACAPVGGGIAGEPPAPATRFSVFQVPTGAMNRGYNLAEVLPASGGGQLVWLEFRFSS